VKALIGTWNIVEWMAEDDSGAVTHPMGQDALGVICYTDEGYVHVHLMEADRVNHDLADTMDGRPEEYVRSAKSSLSYSGRWHIEGDQVIHQVSISSFPNWAPSRQERYMRFAGNELELSTDPIAWGDRQIRHRLRWSRAA
jgi:hypothetical protein